VISVDTNILVRLLLYDDETQAKAAERLVVRARRDRTPIWISDIVLCELVWVLTRRVGLARADIADALDQLLRTELIVVSDAGAADRALAAYRVGKGDFADYLIREQSRAAGASEVATFDRVLKGEDGFRVLTPS
jgi:predicted nucleic-acid-binding protein